MHRDLKIENILMSDFNYEARVRIADVGSAIKLSGPNDTTTRRIGTPGYVAPEVLRGEPYSFPCDIWSLGCLIHVLFSAMPPFWHDDKKQRDQRVLNEPLDFS